MTSDTQWLDSRQQQAWRAYVRMRRQLSARLSQYLLRDSGLSEADYEVLVVLSEDPNAAMTALDLRSRLLWEKSRLSHQARRMEERGLVVRSPNPDDARSTMIALTSEGHRAIEQAAPCHAAHVRKDFIDLLSDAEIGMLVTISERVCRHMGSDPGDLASG